MTTPSCRLIWMNNLIIAGIFYIDIRLGIPAKETRLKNGDKSKWDAV